MLSRPQQVGINGFGAGSGRKSMAPKINRLLLIRAR